MSLPRSVALLATTLVALLALAAPLRADEPALELSLLSYNTRGLPEIVARDGAAERHRRIGGLANAYDLVLLQEDFFHHEALLESAHHPLVVRGNGTESWNPLYAYLLCPLVRLRADDPRRARSRAAARGRAAAVRSLRRLVLAPARLLGLEGVPARPARARAGRRGRRLRSPPRRRHDARGSRRASPPARDPPRRRAPRVGGSRAARRRRLQRLVGDRRGRSPARGARRRARSPARRGAADHAGLARRRPDLLPERARRADRGDRRLDRVRVRRRRGPPAERPRGDRGALPDHPGALKRAPSRRRTFARSKKTRNTTGWKTKPT